MLTLIERAFKDQHIQFLRIDGSVPVPQREKVLKNFSENQQVEVLLMSIGSGSVGYDSWLLEVAPF
jgi:DNA repair protein RAD5